MSRIHYLRCLLSDALQILILNPSKSAIMTFGPIPRSLQVFQMDNKPRPFTQSFKYVGIVFITTARDYFVLIYDRFMLCPPAIIPRAMFNPEYYNGRYRIPPTVLCTLYCGTGDYHFISGADIHPTGP